MDIIVMDTVAGTPAETISVESAQVSGAGTATIVVDIGNLGTSTAYHVLIDAGAFEDAALNDYAGISDAADWNFATFS